MPVLNHIHSYVKYKGNQFNNPNLYKCNHPHCTHFTERALIIDKASICPKCGVEFIMTHEELRKAKPCCLNCSGSSAGRRHRATRSVLDSLIKEETTK